MQKYKYSDDGGQIGCHPWIEPDVPDDTEFYLASDVEALVQILRGALADIAMSEDMTIELAKEKAWRIYKETEGDRQ